MTEPDPPLPTGELLTGDLTALRHELRAAAGTASHWPVHPDNRASAVNMAQFVALRSGDRRELQEHLARRGLSSLGRCEAHVAATVSAVLEVVQAIEGRSARGREEPAGLDPGEMDFESGQDLLTGNAARLLGSAAPGRETRIMVTMPSEAADDEELAARLVGAGMEIARINCAHDGADTWRRIAGHVRAAATVHGRPVRILMDLAGPKLRTGPIADEPGVLRLKPRRDNRGEVQEAALAQLVAEADWERALEHSDLPVVPVRGTPLADLADLAVGDRLHLLDARGASRTLRVVTVDDLGPVVTTSRTTYLVDGTRLVMHDFEARVGPLPPRPGALRLRVGDELRLTADLTPARPGPGPQPPRLGCTLPEALAAAEVGDRILFDDGKMSGEVRSSSAGELVVRITAAPPGGANLRAEKGINLPDTDIPIDAFTAKDWADLAAVVELADLVALSFVRRPRDVDHFLGELAAAGGDGLGVVLKIETVQAFANLPDLLASALAHRDVGVMIARGDLAVEAGYLRLAELQEEILWLCEAAHVPSIWATQVLDTMARTGRPSRSEVTDAAMSDRAECVMLNKGPFIVEAVEALDSILRRMNTLQDKKSPVLRELRSWSIAER